MKLTLTRLATIGGFGGMLYLIFKSKKASANQRNSDEPMFTPRRSNPVKLSFIDDYSKLQDAPGFFIKLGKDQYYQEMGYLNFTPRTNNMGLNLETSDDRQFLDDPVEHYRKNYVENSLNCHDIDYMLHVNDFALLKQYGVIPEDALYENHTLISSNDGKNIFAVGYSEPFDIKTNRDDLTVISPLWAVSCYRKFQSNTGKPDFMSESVYKKFLNVAFHTLYAEFMLTNRGENGCHPNQTQLYCDLERAGILNCLINRYEIKKEKFDESITYASPIYGPGQQWNKGSTFMDAYERKKHKNVKARFDSFIGSTRFWPMPNFVDFATHFIHPWSMSKKRSKNPAFIKKANPYLNKCDPNQNAILLGKSIFINSGTYFK